MPDWFNDIRLRRMIYRAVARHDIQPLSRLHEIVALKGTNPKEE